MIGEMSRRLPGIKSSPVCVSSAPYLAGETHENWLEAHRYLEMNDLRRTQENPPPPSRLPQPSMTTVCQNFTHSTRPCYRRNFMRGLFHSVANNRHAGGRFRICAGRNRPVIRGNFAARIRARCHHGKGGAISA
jgi:hypothetical protein